MSAWKKVKIGFSTIKLGDFIEPIKSTVSDLKVENPIVYGVTNKECIVQTGKPASKDISNYIMLEKDCFAFNPYRVNVGSIGINDRSITGCVSPAYVVFKTKNPELNDLLVSKSGSIGTVVLNNVDFEFSLFESLALIKYNQVLLLPKYMLFSIQSICNNLSVADIKGVCVKHLHLNVLQSQLLALPPLAEQKEIVARVEAKLQTVTALEAQITEREQLTKQLMQSILKEAFEAGKLV